jgi:hypothetical protein
MSRSKGVWPLAPTLFRINANVGVPHLDALSSGGTAGLTQISTVPFPVSEPSELFRTAHDSGVIRTPVSAMHATNYAQILSKRMSDRKVWSSG